MPRLDGLDFLLKMRSDLAPPLPPTILCSGFDLTEEEALHRGACHFLRKPTSPGDLLQAISAVEVGKTPSPMAIEAGRTRASEARQRRLEEASRLMQEIVENAEPDQKRLDFLAGQQIEMLARYLGVPAGVTALVRDNRLIVAASTGETSIGHVGEHGSDLGGALPPCYEVLETGSALVLADASAHPSFGDMASALGGVRYFIGVPVNGPSGVPVGVICLFDFQRREVEAEDLAMLQQFGRNGSAALALLARRDLARVFRLASGGIWSRLILESVLDGELHLLQRRGGSLTAAALSTSNVDEVRGALRRFHARERLMCGYLSDTHLFLCKRSPDGKAADTIDELIAELAEPLELRSVGLVNLEGHGPGLFNAVQLMRLAELGLEHAEMAGGGMVTLRMCAENERIPSPPVIEHQ
jgi:GAF domain-containing protein